jgi:murein DD-endopeptidase MepM/ murein hydrolase activator NlpD
VVDQLADRIFAWKIDFSRDLRPGDAFHVLYERLVRPDGSARSGKVLAVQMDLGGRRHDAYLFPVGGSEDYFDGEGESLRRAFLRAPLEFRRISSAYSTGRFHPILQRVRPHNGIDYAAAAGTPIRAVGDGLVTRAGWGGGYGNVVEIRHQRGYSSRYAHLRGFATGIRPGSRVRQGDLIGYVGSTGLSTGPHLHYEFHVNGRPVNPTSVRYLTGEPVPGGERSRFRAVRDDRIAMMARLSGPLLAAATASDDEDPGEDG